MKKPKEVIWHTTDCFTQKLISRIFFFFIIKISFAIHYYLRGSHLSTLFENFWYTFFFKCSLVSSFSSSLSRNKQVENRAVRQAKQVPHQYHKTSCSIYRYSVHVRVNIFHCSRWYFHSLCIAKLSTQLNHSGNAMVSASTVQFPC